MSTLSDRINFYVINLDRSVDRMERFERDFASFPIPYIRISAVEGKQLTIPVKDYDPFKFFLNIGREALPGEIGCYLSHLKVLQEFLESGKEFALICEDDARPIPESYEVIQQAIANSKSWDLLRLYGGRPKTSFPYQALSSTHNLCIQVTGMVSTAAYIVSRHATGILLKKLVPMTALYDTALFHGQLGIREATVVPHGILRYEDGNPSTIEYGIKRKLKPWNLVYWSCRFYRLWTRTVRYSLQLIRILKNRLALVKL